MNRIRDLEHNGFYENNYNNKTSTGIRSSDTLKIF